MSRSLFKDIIGHEKQCELLDRIKEKNRLAHAFLFVGQEGLGRTTIAMELIESLYEDGKGVERLRRLKEIKANPDVTIVTRLEDEKTGKKKTSIGVEQVRDLCKRLSMSAMSNGYKVAFIEEADTLSISGVNALLKTLEEPKGKTIIILRAPTVESVPATIASRCQVIRFHPITFEVIKTALIERGITRSKAASLASLSMGRPGRALHFLKNNSLLQEEERLLKEFLDLIQSSLPERLKKANTLIPKTEVNKSIVLDSLLEHWQSILRDLLLERLECKELVTHSENEKQMSQIAHSRSALEWNDILERTVEIQKATRHAVNPQLAIEHLLIRL